MNAQLVCRFSAKERRAHAREEIFGRFPELLGKLHLSAGLPCRQVHIDLPRLFPLLWYFKQDKRSAGCCMHPYLQQDLTPDEREFYPHFSRGYLAAIALFWGDRGQSGCDKLCYATPLLEERQVFTATFREWRCGLGLRFADINVDRSSIALVTTHTRKGRISGHVWQPLAQRQLA